MFKEYQLFPRKLTLKFNHREIVFIEPTIYKVMEMQEMMRDEKYIEALELIGIKLDIKKEFMKKPFEILQGVFKLINGERKEDGEAGFSPAVYDTLGKRYGKTPIEIMQNLTFTQVNSISAGIEYNNNIENKKTHLNNKFKKPVDISKYQGALERVRKVKEKLGKT